MVHFLPHISLRQFESVLMSRQCCLYWSFWCVEMVFLIYNIDRTECNWIQSLCLYLTRALRKCERLFSKAQIFFCQIEWGWQNIRRSLVRVLYTPYSVTVQLPIWTSRSLFTHCSKCNVSVKPSAVIHLMIYVANFTRHQRLSQQTPICLNRWSIP